MQRVRILPSREAYKSSDVLGHIHPRREVHDRFIHLRLRLIVQESKSTAAEAAGNGGSYSTVQGKDCAKWAYMQPYRCSEAY